MRARTCQAQRLYGTPTLLLLSPSRKDSTHFRDEGGTGRAGGECWAHPAHWCEADAVVSPPGAGAAFAELREHLSAHLERPSVKGPFQPLASFSSGLSAFSF